MQKQRSQTSRREFLGKTSALAVPFIIPGALYGKNSTVAPSERVTIGVIGQGGMGKGNTKGFMRSKDAQVLAVCDVDKNHLEGGAKAVNKKYGNEDCKKYSDYRELIARDDIDAVCIATPDHWHGICAVEAAKAKKDIYCQKPMAHTFAEGQAMVAAVAENKVIFQTGSQQRSGGNFRRAATLIRNGVIGKVKRVEVGLPTGHREKKNDGKKHAAPGHLNYDFWCGPSELLPYHPDRCHWNWRWHLSYGGGQLMDWIGHHNDIAHWGLDLDKSGPIEVQAGEFEYSEDRSVWNSAWKYEVLCKYEGGYTSSISNRHTRGCKWTGEDGWVFVARGKFNASNPEWIKKDFSPGSETVYDSPEHHRNFLDGVKTRKECICPAETGHRSITPGHLGMVSEALGKRALKWDPKSEVIIGDAEADKLLKKVDFRQPWTI